MEALPQHEGAPGQWDEISERLAALQQSAREDFIEATRATRAFGNDGNHQGQFSRQPAPRQEGEPFRAGEFASQSLEMAFIGYCLGRAVAEEEGKEI